MKAFAIAVAVLLTGFQLQGENLTLHFYPTYSNLAEGLVIYSDEKLSEPPTVTVEAEADGKPLKTTIAHAVQGKRSDGEAWFLATPIRDLDHYRVIKLKVHVGGRTWSFDHPKAGEPLELTDSV